MTRTVKALGLGVFTAAFLFSGVSFGEKINRNKNWNDRTTMNRGNAFFERTAQEPRKPKKMKKARKPRMDKPSHCRHGKWWDNNPKKEKGSAFQKWGE